MSKGASSLHVPDVLMGFSHALYSTWLYYRPDRLLVDCGEGCATQMGNHLFGIEKIFLTHGHIDHISGLPSLVWARASAMGSKDKPLAIYYPAEDPFLPDMRRYLEGAQRHMPYQITWIPLYPEQTVPLKHGRRVKTFATRHLSQTFCLGYTVEEPRKRLKSEFASLEKHRLRILAQSSPPGSLQETTFGRLAVFGGDGSRLPVEQVEGADLLVHEATLLDSSDRKVENHSTLGEALQVAREASVAHLLLIHISGRYSAELFAARARELYEELHCQFGLWILQRHRLSRLI